MRSILKFKKKELKKEIRWQSYPDPGEVSHVNNTML